MANRSNVQQLNDSEFQDDWLGRFARFNQQFGRILRDAVGIFLITLALLTLLALGGFTDGMLLTPWAGLLSLWFGWGAYIVGASPLGGPGCLPSKSPLFSPSACSLLLGGTPSSGQNLAWTAGGSGGDWLTWPGDSAKAWEPFSCSSYGC